METYKYVQIILQIRKLFVFFLFCEYEISKKILKNFFIIKRNESFHTLWMKKLLNLIKNCLWIIKF